MRFARFALGLALTACSSHSGHKHDPDGRGGADGHPTTKPEASLTPAKDEKGEPTVKTLKLVVTKIDQSCDDLAKAFSAQFERTVGYPVVTVTTDRFHQTVSDVMAQESCVLSLKYTKPEQGVRDDDKWFATGYIGLGYASGGPFSALEYDDSLYDRYGSNIPSEGYYAGTDDADAMARCKADAPARSREFAEQTGLETWLPTCAVGSDHRAGLRLVAWGTPDGYLGLYHLALGAETSDADVKALEKVLADDGFELAGSGRADGYASGVGILYWSAEKPRRPVAVQYEVKGDAAACDAEKARITRELEGHGRSVVYADCRKSRYDSLQLTVLPKIKPYLKEKNKIAEAYGDDVFHRFKTLEECEAVRDDARAKTVSQLKVEAAYAVCKPTWDGFQLSVLIPDAGEG